MTFPQFAEAFYGIALLIAQGLLGLAFLLVIIRIVRGPTLPDRVVGLDVLTSASIAFIALVGIETGYTLYVDVAIALGLVGFLATVAFARFILTRGQTEEDAFEQLPFRDPQSKTLSRTSQGSQP
ncbi:sodium:proton antiporter [Fulvimarina endophytica]|uniref:Sodium:proton antiporter n=1 Tax=Fulvimarina endophytica TaxID=2293836 RepID=A0A371X0D5_9HYPH|nr:cation:proton antiporter [Fulvimarina endophytica]RFC62669.1 sodium:proton antiporter [Fulvimarina endophytica]